MATTKIASGQVITSQSLLLRPAKTLRRAHVSRVLFFSLHSHEYTNALSKSEFASPIYNVSR